MIMAVVKWLNVAGAHNNSWLQDYHEKSNERPFVENQQRLFAQPADSHYGQIKLLCVAPTGIKVALTAGQTLCTHCLRLVNASLP